MLVCVCIFWFHIKPVFFWQTPTNITVKQLKVEKKTQKLSFHITSVVGSLIEKYAGLCRAPEL